jgi:hypothetical protein
MEMTNLMDVGGIPDGSPLDRKVQAALSGLFEAIQEIKKASRHGARLKEKGPLVLPVRGRDMRFWRLSDGRKASALIQERSATRIASRIASASKVTANQSLHNYRAMTATQYLAALEEAVITEYRPVTANRGYERVRVLV